MMQVNRSWRQTANDVITRRESLLIVNTDGGTGQLRGAAARLSVQAIGILADWFRSQSSRCLGLATRTKRGLLNLLNRSLSRAAAITKQPRWQQKSYHQHQNRTEPD